MTVFWKRSVVVAITLTLGAVLLFFAQVVAVMTTEIDANLGRPQCPGGKDWDQPGSSCHDGIILDYFPIVDEKTAKKLIAEKKRKDR